MKTLLQILYCIICFVLSAVILFHLAIILTTAITTNHFDLQILIFLLISLILLLGLWSVLLFKIPFYLKVFIGIFLCLIGINYIKLTNLIPSVSKVIDIGYKIDKGEFVKF